LTPVRVEWTYTASDLWRVNHGRRTDRTATIVNELIGIAQQYAPTAAIPDISTSTNTCSIGRHHVDPATVASTIAIEQLILVAILNTFTAHHPLTLSTLTFHINLVVD